MKRLAARRMMEALESRNLFSVITVTSLADNATVDGKVTLREAIIAANTDASVDGSTAGSGADVIQFAKNVKGTINLQSVLPNLSDDVTFIGPGATKLTLRRQASGLFRLLTVETGVTVSIAGLTLTRGNVIESGGAIHNSGTLTLTKCIFSANVVTKDPNLAVKPGGGAVFNNGTLTVTDCEFKGNIAAGDGGAIFNNGMLSVTRGKFTNNTADSGGAIANGAEDNFEAPPLGATYDVTILNSTISNNTQTGPSGAGGGVRNLGKLLMIGTTVDHNTSTGGFGGGGVSQYAVATQDGATLINCTISSNKTASILGGGGIVHFSGPLTLINCTVAFNSASNANASGGGILGFNDASTLINTIVAKNTAPTGRDYSGNVDGVASFNNLIGVDTGLVGITHGDGNKNKVGTAASPLDPQLLPLANNGGLTKTHAIKPKSVAINAGKDSALPLDVFDLDGDGATDDRIPFDQRGTPYDRIRGGTVDIGAYERG